MKITVFGAGYVGLVQAAVLANVGNDVLCVEVDPVRLEALQGGRVPIHEPGLEPMVQQNAALGRLRFTDAARDGVQHGEVLFIAVGTPPDEDGSADLRHVLAVAASIGRHMDGPRCVVNKSTVPVGTAEKVAATIADHLAQRRVSHAFDVVSNPEFLKQGAAVSDCQRPDRIVIGTASEASEQLLRELYAPFNRNHERVVVMDVRSAELTKYAANAMLATKISFINEMAHVAERLGADIEAVRKGIGIDPRIGYHFIYPGIGYGGSCLPKDVSALIHTAKASGFEPALMQAVEQRNEAQKQVLFERINAYYGGRLEGKVIALWGLAFKPNTDDMRAAPSRVLIQSLLDAGVHIQAHDPAATGEARRLFGERSALHFADSPEAALEGADALAVVTEWPCFKAPDFRLMGRRLRDRMVFDGRNLYDPKVMAQHGLGYAAIGRGTPPASVQPPASATSSVGFSAVPRGGSPTPG